MKESILLTFLKLFLDKYFLTTVFAIPLTSLVRFFTPENNRIIQKLGNSTYCLCVFCVCFLAIRFLVCCKQTVRKQRRERRKIREFSYEMDEAIMTFFDKCAPEKRELAYELLANGNQPIQYRYFPWVLDQDEAWREKLNYTKLADGTFLVKLKDDIFEQLLIVYAAHGKISHFAPLKDNNTEVAG